jgi:anti-anti-sigma factor
MPSRLGCLFSELRVAGGRATVTLHHPEFGAVGRRAADERLVAYLLELRQNQLSLDFGRVKLVTSFGLALLVGLHQRLESEGRRLAVLNVQPEVYEVFSLTKLTTVLNVQQQAA